ncbi:hypothetical protein B566_EDAN013479, partial [Ephemera danica]
MSHFYITSDTTVQANRLVHYLMYVILMPALIFAFPLYLELSSDLNFSYEYTWGLCFKDSWLVITAKFSWVLVVLVNLVLIVVTKFAMRNLSMSRKKIAGEKKLVYEETCNRLSTYMKLHFVLTGTC